MKSKRRMKPKYLAIAGAVVAVGAAAAFGVRMWRSRTASHPEGQIGQ